MKKSDGLFLAGVLLCLAPFILSDSVLSMYNQLNQQHGMVMSFLKFALLATAGEVIGLRLRTGGYNQPNFGILPRAVVWGVLGLAIKLSFVVFAVGTPAFLAYMGVDEPAALLGGDFSLAKLGVAFAVSLTLNLIFAPVLMTVHKITDTHIARTGGTLSGLLRPVAFVDILVGMDWKTMGAFVYKKTIPFFWIPAHTITFMLPPDMQVLFAALLGVALGLLLAMAAGKPTPARGTASTRQQTAS